MYRSTISSKLEENGALHHYRALACKNIVWSAKRKIRKQISINRGCEEEEEVRDQATLGELERDLLDILRLYCNFDTQIHIVKGVVMPMYVRYMKQLSR